MNYLAHLYLSDDGTPESLVGALLGDFVKGDDHRNYPPAIQRAILLHRKIDAFTDAHEIFRRDGAHLHCEIPISMATALLGDTAEVPTLAGEVSLKIPAGTQSGKVFRLRGKGASPVRGGPAGDLFCKVKLETPVNLTDEQQELVRQLEKSLSAGGKRHHPRSRSWLDSVKKFFDKLGA